jgi:hypothetical protein
MLLAILLLALAVVVFLVVRKTPSTAKHHWQEFLDGHLISTVDFYAAVKAGLKDRQLPKVAIVEESFLEHHLFSAKRLYLRVSKNEYVYYICAAPYGTGTFISTWLCVKDERLLNRIPVLNRLAGKDRENKTFYQVDTEAMFRMSVQATVREVVREMTVSKGVRGHAELSLAEN